MSVGVQNYCRTSFSFKVERLLQNLLRVVPQEHLIGLDSIILVGQVTYKKKSGTEGKWALLAEMETPTSDN